MIRTSLVQVAADFIESGAVKSERVVDQSDIDCLNRIEDMELAIPPGLEIRVVIQYYRSQ